MTTSAAAGSVQDVSGRQAAAQDAHPRTAILPWWVIASYPVLWLLGLAVLFWPLLLLRVCLVRRPRHVPPGLLIAITSLLALSLAVAVAMGETAPGRALSAVYNIVIWQFLVVALAIRWTVQDLKQVIRGVIALATLQGVVVFVAVWTYPRGSGIRPLLTYLLPPSAVSDPSTQSFLVNNLAFADYYSGPVLRTSGFFGHPNWGAGLAGIAVILVVGAFPGWRSDDRGRLVALRMAQLLACAVPLQYAYSRTTVVAVVVSLGVGAVVALCTRTRRRTWLPIISAGLVGITIKALTTDWNAAYDKFNAPRVGSLLSRSEVYRRTWDVIVDRPVTVLGVGTKERINGLAASLGTHSSYLGLVYRAGWIAAAAFVILIVTLFLVAVYRGQWLAVALISFVGLWSAAEDFDVGHLMPLGLLMSYLLVNLVSERRSRGGIDVRYGKLILGNVLTDAPADAAKQSESAAAAHLSPSPSASPKAQSAQPGAGMTRGPQVHP